MTLCPLKQKQGGDNLFVLWQLSGRPGNDFNTILQGRCFNLLQAAIQLCNNIQKQTASLPLRPPKQVVKLHVKCFHFVVIFKSKCNILQDFMSSTVIKIRGSHTSNDDTKWSSRLEWKQQQKPQRSKVSRFPFCCGEALWAGLPLPPSTREKVSSVSDPPDVCSWRPVHTHWPTGTAGSSMWHS